MAEKTLSYAEQRALATQTKHRVPTTGEGEAVSPVPGIGTFYVPQTQALQNHFMLVYYRDNNLGFWPPDYPSFDGIITQMYDEPKFSNVDHPDYLEPKWEHLRDNIATVRNFLIYQQVKNADLTDKGELNAARHNLVEMGREVGAALQRDSFWRRPFSLHLDQDECSIPGHGAAKVYELLCKKQKPNIFLRPIYFLMGRRYGDWDLPGIQNSPFAAQHVKDFSIERGVTGSYLSLEPEQGAMLGADLSPEQALESELADVEKSSFTPEAENNSTGLQLAFLSAAIAGNAMSLDRVQKLSEPVKDEAIAIARDILNKLKARDGGQPMPQEQILDDTQALAEATTEYAMSVRILQDDNPEFAEEPAIVAANEAIGQLAFQVKQHAIEALTQEGRIEEAKAIEAEINAMPDVWKSETKGGLQGLFETFGAGMELVQLKMQERARTLEQVKAPHMQALLDSSMTPAERQAVQAMSQSDGAPEPEIISHAKAAQETARATTPPTKHDSRQEAVEASNAPQREHPGMQR